MLAKLHPLGTHFKPLALYLLSDKEGGMVGRVVWTQVRNMEGGDRSAGRHVDDPHRAWRRMAATAMNAGALKRAAGIRSAGRKTAKPVLHISLAWPPEDGPVPQHAMLAACNAALTLLGAQDYQTLIVAHRDTPHAHCHVLVNRISPVDGRSLPLPHARRRLAAWSRSCGKDPRS